MSFSGQKITDAQIAAAGVQSQPNKLTGTAAQNKQVFDAFLPKPVHLRELGALVEKLFA